MSTKNKVFVYGTLRNGAAATHRLDYYRMFCVQGKEFDFPFIQETDGDCEPRIDNVPACSTYSVKGNVVELTDKELRQADKYENVRTGLYARKKVYVQPLSGGEYEEVWVYVGGPALVYQPIDNGDWLSR